MYRNILTRVFSTDIESIAGIPYVISVAIRRNSSNGQSETRSTNSSINKKNQTLSLVNNSSNAVRSERNVTQLSNLLPKEYYYPWNDGIDYDFICKSIKNKLDSFHAPPIIHKGFRGGLCHKVRSLIHSFTAALMMKRPLIVMMSLGYWESTDNCLKYMTGPVKSSEPKICSVKQVCLSDRMDMFPNDTIIFQDYRPIRFDRAEFLKLSRVRLPIHFSDWKDYSRILYRIFINPKRDLIDQIVNATKGVEFDNVTSIHIRTGGYLANVKEGAYWVTEEQLPDVVNSVSRILNDYHLSQLVYLTTDSSKLKSYFYNYLQGVEFMTLNMYTPMHTSGNRKGDAYKGALFDLIVAAQGRHILYTPGSGYSSVIRSLSCGRRHYVIPLTRRYLEK